MVSGDPPRYAAHPMSDAQSLIIAVRSQDLQLIAATLVGIERHLHLIAELLRERM